ncbi:MAG: ATP-grasp domain-containing protein [bacterium]
MNNKQKRILIIGAGIYQVAGIQKAKQLGLYVIATDGNRKAPGLKIADKSYVIDVKDADKHIDIAKKNNIDGVLSIASDVSVISVAKVASVLGKLGIPVSAAEKSTDKALMRHAFKNAGLPSPKTAAVTSFTEMQDMINFIGLPAVIKPSDNAGSRGVQLVTRKNELKKAYTNAYANSKNKKIMFEEYIDGDEVSVEAFVYHGNITILTLSDKVRTKPPYLLDVKVIFPSVYKLATQQKIISIAKKAIRSVGITNGPVHMELIMSKNGPVPVELAARGPGFKVFTDIIPLITGIDVVKALIQMSIGEKPNLKRTHNYSSAIQFLDAKDGFISSIHGIEESRKLPNIHEVLLYVNSGDRVKKLTCGSDRIGHIISFAKSRKNAVAAIYKAHRMIKVKIKE